MAFEFWNDAFARLDMPYVVKKHHGCGLFYMIAVQADGSEYLLNSAMSAQWVAESCADKFKYQYERAFPEEGERLARKREARRVAEDAAWRAELAAARVAV